MKSRNHDLNEVRKFNFYLFTFLFMAIAITSAIVIWAEHHTIVEHVMRWSSKKHKMVPDVDIYIWHIPYWIILLSGSGIVVGGAFLALEHDDVFKSVLGIMIAAVGMGLVLGPTANLLTPACMGKVFLNTCGIIFLYGITSQLFPYHIDSLLKTVLLGIAFLLTMSFLVLPNFYMLGINLPVTDVDPSWQDIVITAIICAFIIHGFNDAHAKRDYSIEKAADMTAWTYLFFILVLLKAMAESKKRND